MYRHNQYKVLLPATHLTHMGSGDVCTRMHELWLTSIALVAQLAVECGSTTCRSGVAASGTGPA